MKQVTLTNRQARQFILLKQGLLDDYIFSGEEGVCKYIKQAGCIQFDPIDVCGKNPELVLQSRVKNFTKESLYKLLYIERRLVDYFDKNMAIFSIEDWKYFSRQRAAHEDHTRSVEQVKEVEDKIIAMIQEKGHVSSKDLNIKEKVDWYWSSTSLARAALETLYFRGDLILHHKKGTIKSYGLAKDYIPEEILQAQDPNKTLEDHWKWRVLRRIGGVGLLWNKPSDAWLGIGGLKAANRNKAFEELIKAEKVTEVHVEGITESLYCLREDAALMSQVLSQREFLPRTELIAPLDNLIWDRKLIKKLFNFDYKWEIYTPEAQRKYGYYVLPVLHGDRFIGRIEIVHNKKEEELVVKNLWLEDFITMSNEIHADLRDCIHRFAIFHNCEEVTILENTFLQGSIKI
ncbi:winged helix-turn-helix domain-containing protein [Alkaliphilus serpentinus]|uniref:Winged helix-turn-helix domain-containing protein n=1 Tax=Alkaliphilus serpentinus TaxID=1482731 RepID=A0A833M991_9FIRM|nr:winged helix DNA-binding domain-containing protein [Alkaliphilus serpentinus]KAB3532842.1 winged helix-turn-helix domain-containing protein [Alkaliphilus serpentinus]